MSDRLFALSLVCALAASVAVPAVLVLLLERVPGLRPQDGPQHEGAHSRPAGALMLAGGGGVALLCLLSSGFAALLVPVGLGIAMMGAGCFARDARGARRLAHIGTAFLGCGWLAIMWALHLR